MSTAGFDYRVTGRCPHTRARTGVFVTPHGELETPAFMPVGTRGTVKGVMPKDLRDVGSRMILANTYHLHLRPGEETVKALGGLHAVMNWDGPILTDSGGYQVFSLDHINSIDDDGVDFASIVNGDRVRFTPERVMDIQRDLGADVIMAFDQCPKDPTDRAGVTVATERTHNWLDRCVERWRSNGSEDSGQALFGIVQGGAFEDLRRASVEHVCAHDLVGYAVGGVSVGEDREQMRLAVETAMPLLPENKPRYLMGVGTPLDFYEAIERGTDLFDCVTPTRHARNHQVYTSQGRINLRNAAFKDDTSPIEPDPAWRCPALEGFSRGVLRHLCVTNEMLSGMLLSLHNLHIFHMLMQRMRAAIASGSMLELRREVIEPMSKRLLASG